MKDLKKKDLKLSMIEKTLLIKKWGKLIKK